jgi:glycosyltransferase involved in cell wall biosynthesis
MKRLLIVAQAHYGALVDPYQYCRHLRGSYDTTYLCWDYGGERIAEDCVRIIWVSRKGPKVVRLARLIAAALHQIRSGHYDVGLIVHFPLCGVLGLFRGGLPMIMDIRTGYVRQGGLPRLLHNKQIALDSACFPRVSIISESLRQELRIPRVKSSMLPLGAEEFARELKRFDTFRLLYVGTLQHRHIERTIPAFESLCEMTPPDRLPSYEIVGSGPEEDETRLRRTIEESGWAHRIRFVGRVAHRGLAPYFERNNVGVAYIPMTPYFDVQPATKVFEYLLSGMPVIATRTKENARAISSSNGVLCDDTVEGFARGLLDLFAMRHRYDSAAIRRSCDGHTWVNVVEASLKPMLLEAMVQESV